MGCHIEWCCTTRNEDEPKHVKIMSFPMPWNMKTMEVFNVWENIREWKAGIWKGNAIWSCTRFTFFNRVYFLCLCFSQSKNLSLPTLICLSLFLPLQNARAFLQVILLPQDQYIFQQMTHFFNPLHVTVGQRKQVHLYCFWLAVQLEIVLLWLHSHQGTCCYSRLIVMF